MLMQRLVLELQLALVPGLTKGAVSMPSATREPQRAALAQQVLQRPR